MIIWIYPSLNIILLFLLCSSFPPQTQKTQNSRIIGQYTHNLFGLKTLSFSVILFIHKNMDERSPNWVRHAKCTWSSSNHLLLFTISFQSLLAQLQNDLGNLKTENRQLSLKYCKDKSQEFTKSQPCWLVL